MLFSFSLYLFIITTAQSSLDDKWIKHFHNQVFHRCQWTKSAVSGVKPHANLDMSARRKGYFCYSAHILVTTFLCSASPLFYLSRDATINSDNEVTQLTKSVVVF